MGHRTARRLENGCRKPPGWMDVPPDVLPPHVASKWMSLTAGQKRAVEMFISSLAEPDR